MRSEESSKDEPLGSPELRRSADMGRFWDERAREDPYYFVDNRLEYGNPDTEQFWRQGVDDLDRLLQLVDVSLAPDDRVLEIGCGLGRLTREIAARVAAVQALDVSDEMLRRARALNSGLSNVNWLLGNGLDLSPVEDTSLDACISHVVFQHIPDVEIVFGYVREIGRVLRPGGWAAFQVSNDPAIHRAGGARERLKTRLGRGPRGLDSPEWLGSSVDLAELEAAAVEGGLGIERVTGKGTQYCIVLVRRHQ